LPVFVMDLALLLVVGSASPGERSESNLGLFGRWNLDSKLVSDWKLESELEPLQWLEMPLQSNDSPADGFESLDLNVNCNPAMEPFNLYQYDHDHAEDAGVLEKGMHAGLTEQETSAIFGYTVQDYELLNPIAWGKDEVTVYSNMYDAPVGGCTLYKADMWPEIEVLNSALSKLPPAQPLDATLWRVSGRSAEALGSVIAGGFSSTSRDFNHTLVFARQTRCGHQFGCSSLWAIESHISAPDIAFISHEPGEQEVLFAMGSRLEVKDCAPSTITPAMQTEIEAQELHLEYICNHVDEWFDGHAPDWCSQEIHLEVICMREVSAVVV